MNRMALSTGGEVPLQLGLHIKPSDVRAVHKIFSQLKPERRSLHGCLPAWRCADRASGIHPRARGKTTDLVLARGEATGHAHRIETDGFAEAYSKDGNLFLRVVGSPAKVVHEEHRTIQLPPGTYRVWRQREYDPKCMSEMSRTSGYDSTVPQARRHASILSRSPIGSHDPFPTVYHRRRPEPILSGAAPQECWSMPLLSERWTASSNCPGHEDRKTVY